MNEQAKIATEQATPVLPAFGPSKLDDLLNRLNLDSKELWNVSLSLRPQTISTARIDLIAARLQRSLDHLKNTSERLNG